MNGALIRKTARDSALLLGISVVAVALFQVLFAVAMSNLAPDLLDLWARLAFLRRIFQVLFSIDLSTTVSINTLIVIGFVHPFLFAVTWAFLVTTCTRVTVGEIDRGTADLLLALPVSRASIYASTSVVWVAASALIAFSAWVGVWIGGRIFILTEPLDMGRLGIAAVNQFALYVVIGAITMLVSSAVNRRGVAVAIVMSILLFSFLINFLEAFVPFIEKISFLGMLSYYRPVESVRDGTWPVGDIAVLGAAAAVAWTIGLVIFRRKDVPVR